MIEAFSKANENCEVGFAVNASNLPYIRVVSKQQTEPIPTK